MIKLLKHGAGLLLAAVLLQSHILAQSLPEIVSYADTVSTGPFAIERQAYAGNLKELPIGVFDSGVGGLTVLDAILQLDKFDNATGEQVSDGIADFKNEHFIYLGDQANMPYGNYPAEGKTEFLRELVVRDVLFLLGSRYWTSQTADKPLDNKPPVKAIVIACNTATAYGYEIVRQALEIWNIPVYLVGVVDAGARGALSATGGKGAVAVMATVGTCNSEGYVHAVKAAWESENLPSPPVVQQGCLGLAGAIEGDLSYISSSNRDFATYRGPSFSNPDATIDHELLAQYGFEPSGLIERDDTLLMLNSVDNYISYHALTLLRKYAASGVDTPLGGVILGCTHFPFYSDQLENTFSRLRTITVEMNGKLEKPYAGLLAEKLVFIDPAVNTATELYTNLKESGLLIKENGKSAIATDEFYISVPNTGSESAELTAEGNFTYEFKYGRIPGAMDIEYVRRVPMTAASLSESSRGMIRDKLPQTWERLRKFNADSPRLKDTAEKYLIH